MALSDKQIRALKPRDKPYKVADEKGLYLQIPTSGGKLWRLKYRILGVEKKLALGAYPEISLAEARALRDDARAKVALGIDPALAKQRDKVAAQINAGNTFAAVAEEFIATRYVAESKAPATVAKSRWLLSLLMPTLGKRPIAEIEPQELLHVLKVMEKKGRFETVHKCRAFASQVFRFGVATARCKGDPALLISQALTKHKPKHHAALLEPKDVGELLRAVESYTGHATTCYALQISPHVMLRPGELRKARWEDCDLEAGIWTIPATNTKMRRDHAVPLSRQVKALLAEWAVLNGQEGYIFPSARTRLRPMSENAVNFAFRAMGYTGDQVTAHGLRTTASSLLNQSGKWHPDAIERQLAHGDSDAVRGIYNRGNYWEERLLMMQWWSDQIDIMRKGAEVIPFTNATAA